MKFFPIRSLFRSTKYNRLTDSEKIRLDQALQRIMQDNPVRNQEAVRHVQMSNYLFLTPKYMFVSIALVIAALLSGGGVYAAQESLPGDVLYPVKIHVTEAIEDVLARSDEAQAKFEERRVNRRLDEVTKLVTNGKLEAVSSTTLRAEIEAQIAAASRAIESLDTRGKSMEALTRKASVHALLNRHKGVLGLLTSTSTSSTTSTQHATTSTYNKNQGARHLDENHESLDLLGDIIESIETSIGEIDRIIITPSGNAHIQIKKDDRIESTSSTERTRTKEKQSDDDDTDTNEKNDDRGRGRHNDGTNDDSQNGNDGSEEKEIRGEGNVNIHLSL